MWMYVSELRLARFWSAFGKLKCHLYALNVACHPEYKPPGYPNPSTCKSQGNKNFRVVATLPYAHPHSSLATLFSALHFAFIFFVRLFFCCLLLAAAAKICSPHTISPPNFPSSICHFLIRLKFIFYPLTTFVSFFCLASTLFYISLSPGEKLQKCWLVRLHGVRGLTNCTTATRKAPELPPVRPRQSSPWECDKVDIWVGKTFTAAKFKHK